MRKIRKSIRLNGKLVSESFTTSESAKAWYSQLHSKKIMENYGLAIPAPKEGVLFKEFALEDFIPFRKAHYPASTWGADEQRLRDYILPAFGNMQIARITPVHVRALLESLVTSKRLNPKTRDRVRALVSAIFSHGLNRKEPVVSHNPTFGLSFTLGRRRGEKAPSYLRTNRECVSYMLAARELSPTHLGIAGLGLLAGLRKQEMIPLRFGRVDCFAGELEVCEKFIQASGEIVRGTKSGDLDHRSVPISDDLIQIIKELRLCNRRQGDKDFVLQSRIGTHLSPRQITRLHLETCARAKVEVTVHGLRHSFGREFAQRSGNLKALQAILGHSNSSVTDIYSDLAGDRLKDFRGVVSFGLGQKQTKTDVE